MRGKAAKGLFYLAIGASCASAVGIAAIGCFSASEEPTETRAPGVVDDVGSVEAEERGEVAPDPAGRGGPGDAPNEGAYGVLEREAAPMEPRAQQLDGWGAPAPNMPPPPP